MAKSMGKTIANIVILSAITLSCAATAIGIYAMNRSGQVDPNSSSVSPGSKEARSILKIEKTDTLGLIDEYTITYTDGTTSKFLVTNGKNGTEGIQGLPGQDGHTPTIAVGTNGNWVVDGVDLGIRAEGLRGPQGEAGRGIVSITKTNTSGQIDEYTITYTDNTTSTFIVTNGTNGEQGIQGFPGTDGHTPAITIGTNGNWHVDGVDTGVHATGPAGANGKSAYEIAVDNGYPGTETEWLLSLIGAAGAIGPAGANGKSAYEIAVDNGYPGTEAEWLESLIGQNGNNGMSAYQLYCESHIDPDLSEPDWIASLYGKSAYDIYCSVNPGPDMSESDWLASLVGADGSDGRGIASITGPVTSGSYDTYTINYTDGSTPTEFIVKNGIDGNDGSSLLTGTADPLPALGNNGDSYINTTTWNYFTKSGNAWTLVGNIKGESGTDGTNGINGNDGKSLYSGDGEPTITANTGDSYIDYTSCDYYMYNGTSWDLVANIKGATGNGITSIALTDSSEANRDQYTITYSDGTSFSYYVAKPRSIVSIAKTGESGLVDTYTITYTYGETSTFTVTNGENGKTIIHGETAPENDIGNQGDVYIDTHNFNMYFKGISSWGTPISFKGTDGADGVGISSIAKTDDSGLVDTYTITYTDGNTFDFTVTNGANGKDGTKVVTGTSEPTSTVGYQLGDSYIDTTTWKYYVLIENASEELVWDDRGTIKGADGANGTDGVNGADGKDGTKLRVGDTAPTDTTGYQEGDSYLDTSTWDFYVLTKDGEGNLSWGSAVGNIHNSPNVLTVTFESNGGTAVASIDDALEGEKITKPADPTKDGYFFEGWYTSEGNKWAFEKDVLTENITLLARWGRLEVTNGVLTGCTLTGRIDIPYVYNGEVISAISSDAFRGNVNLEAITLPASIKEIPAHAFEGCEGLFEVTLPESVTSIGERAFSSCENLIKINLPNSITTIGDYAFSECYCLQAVDLPDRLTAISEGMFCYCGGLQHIIFNEDGWWLESIGSHAFDYCYCLQELIIPNSVTSIAENCFVGDYDEYPYDYELYDLSLPFIGFGENGDKGLIDFFDGSHFPGSLESVKITGSRPIFEGAFDGCDQITYVEFTGSPSKFDLNCLRGLTNIQGLNLPYLGETNSNPTNKSYLGHLFGATSVSNHDDYVPASLYGVQVRGGKVGAQAFANCSVGYVIFGENVTGFEKTGNSSYGGECHTLYHCNNLEYLEVPFVGISANTTDTHYSFLGSLFGSSVDSSNVHYVPNSLKEVTINSASSLPNKALSYLPYVETINLNQYLTSIGEEAFNGCSGLKSISIPDSVKTIGRGAFSYCYALETVKLPSNPNFTTIGSGTFYKCTSLKTILIPDTVTSIGSSAFYECYKLITADLGDGVTSIGAYAFNNCHDLRNVRLGSALQTIGQEAFKYCENLNNIVIPKSVTSIGDNAFCGCSGLTNLSFEYVYNGDPLTIGRWAFMDCYALPSVALPDRTESLGYCAFADCRALTYIYIPNNCSIDDSCFSQDVSLRSISFPSNVTLGNYVLSRCDSITSISLWSIPSGGVANLFGTSNPPTSLKTIHIEGNSMASIPNGAFKYLRSVTAIDLPLGVTSIGDEAFYDCQSLLNINLRNVEHIGKYAFYNCYSLSTISSFIDEGTVGEYAFQNCHSLVSVTINSSNDLTVGQYAFDNCDGLLSVNIFASNTSNLEFGSYAFRNCDGLQTVTISKQDDANIDFGEYTFASCNALTYVRFGNSGSSPSAKDLKTGNNAFRDCSSLKFVENNSKDLVVGHSAFNGCKTLKYFRGSGASGVGIKSIGNNGFSNCWSLEVLHYDGLTSIGNYAFSACYAFKSISLPDTVTTMGDGVFWGCTYLESAKLPFNDELTTIPSSTFYKCPALKSFNISSNFDTIGSYAFQETGLVSIDIPNTITSIKNGAFSSCHSLKSVKLPENSGYTKIEDNTFYDCTALESIRIPSNVFTIGNNVFRGDTSLKTLTIIINTSKILNIGSDSFRDVELTTINFTGTQTEYEYFTSAPGSNAYTQSGNDTLKNTYPGVTVNYDYVEA